MNKTLICILLVLSITSCNRSSNKKQRNWDKKYQEIEQEKTSLRKAISDSIVNLSFNGLVLGEHFEKTISSAKQSGKIKNVKMISEGKDKSATCEAVLFLANRTGGVEVNVDVYVTSFQDTITSFIVTSDCFDTHKDVLYLYENKYNIKSSVTEENYESWGNLVSRSCNDSRIWTFKNQSLRISNFFTEKRKNYIKDASKRAAINRYGVKYTRYFKMVTIIYSDLRQLQKVENYNAKKKIERNKLRAIEKAKRAKKDSLLILEAKQKSLNQDI